MIKNFTITVPPGVGPVRLDKFLQSQFPDIPRSMIHKAIITGLVLLGGRRVRKGDLLRSGDEVYVQELSSYEEVVVIPNPDIPLKIAYEDKEVIVVEKPARIPTHPLEPEEKGTLTNALVARYPELTMVGDSRLEPGLVHRLDNDTSGLLVVARTPRAYTVLKEEFRQEVLKKEYLALVLGEVDRGGKIDSYVGHHPESQKKMEVFKEKEQIFKHKARRALTFYEIEKRFQGYTLVRVTIKTGVMHQIRVHFASIDHPLAGDRLYQRSRFRKADTLGLTRQFLHSSRLGFYHPQDRRWLEFFSALPEDLAKALSSLKPK